MFARKSLHTYIHTHTYTHTHTHTHILSVHHTVQDMTVGYATSQLSQKKNMTNIRLTAD
jgi:hypothetical protein